MKQEEEIKKTGLLSDLHPNFSTSEVWRLIIDGNRQNEGPLAFDKGNRGEPGYVEAMKKMLNFIIQEKDTILSASFIEQIHDLSIQLVKKNIESENIKNQILIEKSKLEGGLFDLSEPKVAPQENFRNNIGGGFGLTTSSSNMNRSNLTKKGLENVTIHHILNTLVEKSDLSAG